MVSWSFRKFRFCFFSQQQNPTLQLTGFIARQHNLRLWCVQRSWWSIWTNKWQNYIFMSRFNCLQRLWNELFSFSFTRHSSISNHSTSPQRVYFLSSWNKDVFCEVSVVLFNMLKCPTFVSVSYLCVDHMLAMSGLINKFEMLIELQYSSIS